MDIEIGDLVCIASDTDRKMTLISKGKDNSTVAFFAGDKIEKETLPTRALKPFKGKPKKTARRVETAPHR